MAILVASSLAAVAAGDDPARWLALATLQAIMIGAIQLTAGVARVGFIADFIPKSVITGFLNGMALIIIVSQLGKITGINLTQEDFFPRIWEFYNKTRSVPSAHLDYRGRMPGGSVPVSLRPHTP